MEADAVIIGNYVVEVLQSLLNEDSPPLAEVQRAWELTHDLGTMEGKKIDVYAVGWADGGPVTRRESFLDVTVTLVIIERYTGDLDGLETEGYIPHVPISWVDERVAFVEQKIFNPLSAVEETTLEGSTDNPLKLGEWWTETAVVTTLCDPDFLRQQKVFWSEIELTFRKVKG